MTMTKCGPILFTGPMVKAILDGRKRQTRRVAKNIKWIAQTAKGIEPYWRAEDKTGSCAFEAEMFNNPQAGIDPFPHCPYGQAGDRLWVRESCRAEELPSGLDGVRYVDGQFLEIENSQQASDRWGDLYRYRNGHGISVPSIHMPRWASRIDLEITGVRVERLNDISVEDAKAEGIEQSQPTGAFFKDYRTGKFHVAVPVYSFFTLWESINGPGSWSANPWVWVIEFKRQESAQ